MSQQSKALPTDANALLLVADDVRQEIGGKLTLMGYMPGNRLKVGPAPSEPNTQEALQSLAILMIFRDGAGDFEMGVSLIDPTGTEVFPAYPRQSIHKNEDGPMNVNLIIRPFPIQLGTFTLTVSLDDRRYQRSFSVERGELP